MKKCWIFAIALALTGCAASPTFETIADVPIQSVAASAQQILVSLPNNAVASSDQNEKEDTLYLCDGYTLSVQTMEGGDLDKTLRSVSGYGRDSLDLIETLQGDARRYICAWSAAGEEQMQVGRTCIIDDGTHHYVLTAMAGESEAGKLQETWQEIFSSFRVVDADLDLNTGS